MVETNLLAISLTAFAAVFVILAMLAGVMKAIVMAFPAPAKSEASEVTVTRKIPLRYETDQASVAAISSVMQNIWPGSTVSNIQEIK